MHKLQKTFRIYSFSSDSKAIWDFGGSGRPSERSWSWSWFWMLEDAQNWWNQLIFRIPHVPIFSMFSWEELRDPACIVDEAIRKDVSPIALDVQLSSEVNICSPPRQKKTVISIPSWS